MAWWSEAETWIEYELSARTHVRSSTFGNVNVQQRKKEQNKRDSLQWVRAAFLWSFVKFGSKRVDTRSAPDGQPLMENRVVCGACGDGGA